MNGAATMSGKTHFLKTLAICSALICLTIAITTEISRADQVSAALQHNNNKLTLKVFLASPPPVNLIAQITIPAQVKIVSTSPKATKVDRKKSMIKWLVKNPQAGTLQFAVTTSPGADPSSVAAVVLYRKPGDGSLIKIKAKAR